MTIYILFTLFVFYFFGSVFLKRNILWSTLHQYYICESAELTTVIY